MLFILYRGTVFSQSSFYVRAARIKAHELRTKSKTELQAQVGILQYIEFSFASQQGDSASDYIKFVKAMSAQLLFQLSVLTATFMLQLKDLKQELGALRVAKVTGGAPNKLSKM